MEEYINNIITNAKINQLNNPEDYYKGDILYCGKCDTPKQCIKQIFGKTKILPCICQCRKDEIKKEEEISEQIRHQNLIEHRRDDCFCYEKMKNYIITDSTDNKIKNFAYHFEEYLANGKGLFLFGTTGTGKTYSACCIANHLIDNGYTAKVTNFNRISNEMQETYNGKQRYLDELNDYDLLVIDDLDTERDTTYMNEIVYSVIDGRTSSGKPLIITTNMNGKQIKQPDTINKQRILSRILQCCIPIEMSGTDKRKEDLKINYADDIKKLEG